MREDEETLRNQRNELIKLIDELQSRERRYTSTVFNMAKKNWPKSIKVKDNDADDARTGENSLASGLDLDILILCLPGKGTSSTAQNLVGNRLYETWIYTEDQGPKHLKSSAVVDGRTVTVYGLCELILRGDEKSRDGVREFFDKSFQSCPQGFHAILVLVQLGDDDHAQTDLTTVCEVEKVLGGELLHDYGAVVFADGDDVLETSSPRGPGTSETRCWDRTGPLQGILEKCDHRGVRFNSMTEDEETLRNQRNELIKLIDELQSRERRYTSTVFNMAKKNWPKSIKVKDNDADDARTGVLLLPPTPVVNIFLVGETGCGKSSTGNSILGRRAFETSSGVEACTTRCEFRCNMMDGHIIRICDTPGLCLDAGPNREASCHQTRKSIEEGAMFVPSGFHAVLIVCSMALKIRRKGIDVFNAIDDMLGAGVLESHGVVVYTGGDFVKSPAQGHGDRFQEWCKKHKRGHEEILQKCQNRFILFNNMSDDETVLISQRRELIKIINCISC